MGRSHARNGIQHARGTRGAGEAHVTVAGGHTMDRVAELLQRDARLATDTVTRPHELLVTAWRTLAAPNGRAQGETRWILPTS